MTVRQLFAGGQFVTVSGAGYEPVGKFLGPDGDAGLTPAGMDVSKEAASITLLRRQLHVDRGCGGGRSYRLREHQEVPSVYGVRAAGARLTTHGTSPAQDCLTNGTVHLVPGEPIGQMLTFSEGNADCALLRAIKPFI